jgi:hypothetical protein
MKKNNNKSNSPATEVNKLCKQTHPAGATNSASGNNNYLC